MRYSSSMRATTALLVWLLLAIGIGYFARQGLERIFGPDTWWLVTGWAGAVIGLMHFLLILIFARQPRVGR